MWLHYFLCLALLVEFTDGKALFTKFMPKITSSKKPVEKVQTTNDVNKGNVELSPLKGKDDNSKKASEDAPWCQDAIDTWDCEEYKENGLCDDVYGKHYHMCEKTCSGGTCKSPFL